MLKPLTREQQELVTENLGLVRFLAFKARKGKPKNVLLEDLIGAGMIGLCEAASRFDPARGLKFATLATVRVAGAIQDEIRRAYGRLSDKKGQAKAAAHLTTVSYDLQPVADERPMQETENRTLINQILARVSERDRVLVALFFASDTNVAKVLGKSRFRAAQLKAQLLNKLRRVAA
jgi:RNA polymerase sigma factor (sigma-70 family)